ncbi:hypothetical protein A3715_33275 [Oleiphilus sp. HI0009]|nr:hypothetical protein A3715_15930 [Oleiphilus sp. HI0009]KZX82882.1 hypothetical protein A3715_33275 [Oleiphilus sp. HI0009]
MIIGYQVKDNSGRFWNGRTSSEVLTEETAIKELSESSKNNNNEFQIVAVPESSVENPVFENTLSASTLQYKTIAVSPALLCESDCLQIEVLANDPNCNMIMGRDTGWFVKLYEEAEYNLGYEGMSDQFHCVLNDALKAGYRCIEFDGDVELNEN